jgi:hypothetical protein
VRSGEWIGSEGAARPTACMLQWSEGSMLLHASHTLGPCTHHEAVASAAGSADDAAAAEAVSQRCCNFFLPRVTAPGLGREVYRQQSSPSIVHHRSMRCSRPAMYVNCPWKRGWNQCCLHLIRLPLAPTLVEHEYRMLNVDPLHEYVRYISRTWLLTHYHSITRSHVGPNVMQGWSQHFQRGTPSEIEMCATDAPLYFAG